MYGLSGPLFLAEDINLFYGMKKHSFKHQINTKINQLWLSLKIDEFSRKDHKDSLWYI